MIENQVVESPKNRAEIQSDLKPDIESRLRQLTPAQRARLAAKLQDAHLLPPTSSPTRKQLVAYVIPAHDVVESDELRGFLRQRLPDYMIPTCFVALDDFPRMPNGKIDRKRLPPPDFSNRDSDRAYVAPRSDLEEQLATIWARALGVKKVGLHDNFFELGGDSILTIQIVARANRAGLRLTPNLLFQHQTVAELAAVASMEQPAVIAEQGLVVGAVPLTPIQQWFFAQDLPNRHHWNQTFLFELMALLDAPLVEQILADLLEQHDALRLAFTQGVDGWQQSCAGALAVPKVETVDLSGLSAERQAELIEQRATALQESFALAEAPLIRCLLFTLGDERRQRLLIAAHHLVIDGVSWRILLEDFEHAYQQRSRGEAVQLPPKTTSFQTWSRALVQHAQSEGVRQELDYWLSRFDLPDVTLPLDHGTLADNSKESECMATAMLSQGETQALIGDVPTVYNTQISDILLTALTQTITRWSGTDALLLELEGHGREEISDRFDLSRTIGWFTTTYPVQLRLDPAAGSDTGVEAALDSDLGRAIKSMKEQLRQIPNRGIGYGLLRYLNQDEQTRRQLASTPAPQLLFNYLGQLDQTVAGSQLFRFATEEVGPFQSRAGSRAHLFEVNTLVLGRQLRIEWKYSRNLHSDATVQALAEQFATNLRTIVAHCAAPTSGGYTPSDFPEAALDQSELDALAAEFG